MATVSDLNQQACEVSELLVRLVQVRQIRDPLAHLHPDLTGPQIHVVVALAIAGVPMPTTEIGTCIAASAPTMTGIIDRLERQGLVTRVRDEQDRRVVLIALTDAGRTVFETLRHDAIEKITNLLGCLNDDERATFIHLIGRIVAALTAQSDGATGKPTP